MLDPGKAIDRRITAFSRSRVIKTFPNGDIWLGTFQYDCWGKKREAEFTQRVTPEVAKEKMGQKSHITLELTQRGCCPPQLMKDFIQQEGGPAEERDPVLEAMKLHKRGYLGGGD